MTLCCRAKPRMKYLELAISRGLTFNEYRSFLSLPYQTMRDFPEIEKLGVFQAYCYKKAYLRDSTAHRIALLHYLLVGERRGNLPNAFFDPRYCGSSWRHGSKRLAFAEYLRSPSPSTPSPSANFDHQWYCAQNPDWQRGFSHPFLHFWHKGLFEGRDPAPHIDIAFFARAAGRGRPDVKIALYEALADKTASVPRNPRELRNRQDRFYERIELRYGCELSRPRYPFLVFVQASQGYRSELLSEARGFDLMLNFYDKSQDCPPEADYVFFQTGTKTTAIRKILEQRPDIFERYEAILFLDDDIEIDRAGAMRIFETMKKHNLDLVQASLTPDSSCYWDIIKHPPEGDALCPLSSIEIMMPAISRRALRECGWVFKEGVSGWAIDFLLSAQVRHRFGNKIALARNVIARHGRPTDAARGAFYEFLRKHGIDPNSEAACIAWRHGVDDSDRAISRHDQPLDFS